MVRSFLVSRGSLKVKGHDVILTNLEKEDLEQGEGEISCHHITILEELEIETLEEDAEEAPHSLEDGGQSTVDELKEEMPGLDSKVAVHHLAIKLGYRPIKQAQRRFQPELIPQTEVEVNKLIEARFIRKVKYPTCIANIVPNAFDSVKKYLLNPPVLGAPIPGKSLILYIAAQERSLGALLAQEKEKGKERALYYLSRTLVGVEVNYYSIEKMCLALFFAIDKLRHYMQAITIHLVAKADPIKTSAGGFLADHPIPSDWKLCEDFPDDEVFFTEVMEPWTMYFDDAARRSAMGAGIVLISPEKHMLPYSFVLAKLCSNNVAEYHILIIGLQMALEIGVSFIEIYGDSKLIINQLLLQYDVKHEDLKPYFAYARQLMERFDSVMLEHVPRTENKRADTLANLATALMMPDNVALNMPLCQQWIMPPVLPECQEANVTTSHLIDEEDWRQPIIEYLEHEKLPKDSRHKTGPFEAWGFDLVGSITPKSSAGHSYILAATDYFSKWAEAIPLREAKKENVVNFIRTHIIYRYGIPHRIVTDNVRQFSNSMIDKLCEKFKFKQYKSSMYNAAANGLAEAFNKTLRNLLKKIVSKSKRDWQERIGEAAVLPLEKEIPSLRITVQEGLTTEDNVKLRLQDLEALDEKRLEAQQALECYQARMSKAFNKHVKPRSFQVGDLVLAVRRPIITTRHTGNKFTPKWDGPYIVKEVYTNGSFKCKAEDFTNAPPTLRIALLLFHVKDPSSTFASPRRHRWYSFASISPNDEGARSLLPGWCLNAPTWVMDLTAKARSSPDICWIADGNITPSNDEGARSLLPGRWI
ncbi:uncharacterized protein E5676_scaffold970G00470 [Cucumis melo var. makuwa]|uniref:Uncharacterized protein n=1 Tax=Cucumis melo var. makuwa TaxID=1194695 RepID=A0A5D3DVF5_CUCMM|nr:uncharacterized protein E6C27_scaffold126G00590 [Cucumis melo var. makuwa]TYK27492.1 uncharacterized protein E5676_scaffold970G00470 [Cucumis melo var. makuwa]